jgi:hypothetical protein
MIRLEETKRRYEDEEIMHQIMWYFRSNTACALCLYSAIPPILVARDGPSKLTA